MIVANCTPATAMEDLQAAVLRTAVSSEDAVGQAHVTLRCTEGKASVSTAGLPQPGTADCVHASCAAGILAALHLHKHVLASELDTSFHQSNLCEKDVERPQVLAGSNTGTRTHPTMHVTIAHR